MRKMICDRCGADANSKEITLDTKRFVSFKRDLCDECYKLLEAWLQNK